jgi:glucosylceramidase
MRLVLSLIAFVMVSCAEGDRTDSPIVTDPVKGEAKVWLTLGDKSALLSPQKSVSLTNTKSTSLPIITIDSTKLMQEIEGFGAALTGSSAYLMNKKLSATERNALLNDLFDVESGIGISYLRMSIGASDFSPVAYTYDDMPYGETDFSLDHFSIATDEEDVVPVFKEILEIAPDIAIMGSPWSPPAWMKTNGNLKGGGLKTETYDAYARYLVKYLKAYAAHGISIDAVTLQNEPLYAGAPYPCMKMTAEEQLNFIKDHVGPMFQAEGIETKIIVYDHNYDNTDYPISILNDADARQYVAGSAFHAYGGEVGAMTVVHNAHPDKGLYFTEIGGGDWSPGFDLDMQWNMNNVFIGTTKNWSKVALLWNLALDQDSGPNNSGDDITRGVVTINNISGDVTKNPEYYAIGHMSKFVRPGAFRIESSASTFISQLNFVAFMNADGSKAIVFANSGAETKSVTLKQGERQFDYNVPANSVATVVWN